MTEAGSQRESDTVPELPEDVVHVWWAQVPAAEGPSLAYLRGLLDSVERDRMAAYRHAADGVRFLLGCAIVRLACARYLGCAPAEVALDRQCRGCGRQHGKVRLVGRPGPRFSVSHSGAWVGVAFARDAEVGIDVEQVRDIDVETLGRFALTAGEAGILANYPDRVTGFLRYWTRKEAAVKATGDGIGVGLNQLEVSAPDQSPAVLEWPGGKPSAVHLYDLRDRLDHVACLAILGDRRHRVSELDAEALLEVARRTRRAG